MISDPAGVHFLQWALPRLRLRWPGFRKVRRQVYKRISRRLQELGLWNLADYRDYLEHHPEEWKILDSFCWISISRFYRDQRTFLDLEHEILPQLAELALGNGADTLRCWSAGCSGGEEPYTLSVVWQHRLQARFPSLRLQIIATDINPRAIQRAQRGCYQPSSLKELPADLRNLAFTPAGEDFCIKERYRKDITFAVQDIRERAPEGAFHLILCRNLVFTYFDEAAQRATLSRLTARLVSGGALIIGKLETLPAETTDWCHGPAAQGRIGSPPRLRLRRSLREVIA